MYVIPKLVNNQDVQSLGAEIPKLAKEWLEDLRPNKEVEKTNKN